MNEPSARNRARINLEGSTILLFGGGGNLARAFIAAAAAAGARLLLVDLRRALEDFETNPPTIEGYAADVTKLEEVEAACDWAWAAAGRVDVVVNFAGLHHPSYDLVGGDAGEMLESFRRVVDVNLTGAFIVTMAVSRRMVPLRAGHIIHLCSSGSRLSLYGSYAYNATKHGVEGLVKTAAAQLAPFGVRVNGIAPGTVITPLNRSLLVDDSGDYTARAKSVLAHTPTKRFATPEGVAASLLAMCVDQPHLTGNVIFADDGYNIEGHSWPEGNEGLYSGTDALEHVFQRLAARYPPPDENEGGGVP